MSAADGRFVTVRWLVGVLVTVLILGVGSMVSEMRADIQEVRVNQQLGDSVRIELRMQQQLNQNRLDRIERKLDALLARRP